MATFQPQPQCANHVNHADMKKLWDENTHSCCLQISSERIGIWNVANIFIQKNINCINCFFLITFGTYNSKTNYFTKMILGPFSIFSLEAQVIWNFSFKSLDHFPSSLQVTWKPSDWAKCQVISVADLEMSWVPLTSLFVFCIFSNSYMWHYVIYFTICIQMAVSLLFIDKLPVCVWCHWLRHHHRL